MQNKALVSSTLGSMRFTTLAYFWSRYVKVLTSCGFRDIDATELAGNMGLFVNCIVEGRVVTCICHGGNTGAGVRIPNANPITVAGSVGADFA